MKILQRCLYPLIFLFILCSSVYADSLLIVNNSVAQTSISKDQVQLIFLGKMKKWENGEKIRVGTLKDGAVHESFLNEYVDKTPSKYSSYWKIKIVSGTGIPPKMFDTEEKMVEFIAENKGAVGYISADTPHENVKTLMIK